MITKVWTVGEIKELIKTNNKLDFRSVVKLYGLQTASEQDEQETHECSSIDFNDINTAILSSFTKEDKNKD